MRVPRCESRRGGARCVKFNQSSSNTLITVHPADEALEDDLRPYKGLLCIWNTASPSAPDWILECSGTPTSASFSSTQSFIVAAGTAEGVIYLWDLREAASIHRDRDATDLGIDRGIRRPSYSTAFTHLDIQDGNSKHVNLEDYTHNATITQIDTLGSYTMSVTVSASQFYSVQL